MSNKITGKIFLIITIITIIIALLNLFACRAIGDSQEDAETFEVTRGDIIQTVTTSGYVDSSEQNDYSLSASGKVLCALSKGDTFSKGDVLIEIDGSKQELLIAQAEENLNTAKNSIDIAKINYQQALGANHVSIQIAQSNAVQSEQATQNALTSLENANSAADASLNSARLSAENSNSAADASLNSARLSAENSNSAANASINSAKVALDITQDNYDKVKADPLSTPEEIDYARNSLKTAQAAYDQAVTLAQNSTNSAQAAYDQAVTLAQNSTNSAQAAYEQAKANAQSQAESAEAAYQQALNSQSASYWSSLSSTETAQVQIKLTKKNIEQVETQLKLSEINLELARLDMGSSIIHAPYSGIVLSSVYKEGQYASPGINAISIISSDFIIKANVNEIDVVNLQVGQDVDIRLDAYYENEFSGKIIKISPISSNIGGVVSFELTVKPETGNGPEFLYGLSASLTITTSGVEDVLFVPIQSVYEENGKSYVDLVAEDGSTEKKEVTTGMFNYDFIEIKSGLNEGDTILTSPTSSNISGSLMFTTD